MKKNNRYSESRGVENLGSMLNDDMNRKYGKSKEIPAFINRKAGRDEFDKQQSIAYQDSPDTDGG